MARTLQRVITIRIDPELEAAMNAIRQEHGTPISEQIRRGLRMWLESRGALKPARTPTPARKRRQRA